MGGLQRLFLRITPIIMLICFICFGITHAFQQAGQPNITYLTHEVIAVDDNNTPNDTTDDITIDNYTFDVQSYANNININILKRATTNIINLEAYTETINGFKNIWRDGYQFGDGVHTIVNAIILAINTLLVPLNVILAPIRIIAGILLTAFSLVGININRETIIITSLNAILDHAAIPMINPTFNKDDLSNMAGEQWHFSDEMYGSYMVYVFDFKDMNNNQYTALYVKDDNGNTGRQLVWYVDQNDNIVYVYIDVWVSTAYQTIEIVNMPQNQDEQALIYRFLRSQATQVNW